MRRFGSCAPTFETAVTSCRLSVHIAWSTTRQYLRDSRDEHRRFMTVMNVDP